MTKQPVTTREVRVAREMLNDGASISAIATALGRSYHSVSHIIRDYAGCKSRQRFTPEQSAEILKRSDNRTLATLYGCTTKQICTHRHYLKNRKL